MIRLRSLWEADVLLEVFVVANFAFLSLDIYVAHSINRFRHWAEWIPLVFSLLATAVMAPEAWRAVRLGGDWIPSRRGTIVGSVAVAVGILGMLLHLDSHFFAEQTLQNLVYMAPFVGPLSYAGGRSRSPRPGPRSPSSRGEPPDAASDRFPPRGEPTSPLPRPAPMGPVP